MENPIQHLKFIPDCRWVMSLGVYDGYIGLHFLSIDCEILQTPIGSIDFIVQKATSWSNIINSNKKEFESFLGKIKKIHAENGKAKKTYEQVLIVIADIEKWRENKNVA